MYPIEIYWQIQLIKYWIKKHPYQADGNVKTCTICGYMGYIPNTIDESDIALALC